jgi:hypothetical protein
VADFAADPVVFEITGRARLLPSLERRLAGRLALPKISER